MEVTGYLQPDDELREIFPTGEVPLVSIIPFVPRQKGCPTCYKVDSKKITPEQLNLLAQRIFNTWQPECESVEIAVEYITNNGLPVRCRRFTSVSTTDYGMLPVGVALAVAVMLREMPEEDF